MIKQIHIDKGQIGGVIQVITQSMFIVNIFNFIGVWTLLYDRFLRGIIPFYLGMCIVVCCALAWWTAYYSIIYPSLSQYSNKQAWKHNSPIKAEFERLNKRLDDLEAKL